jgi:DNA-directed RNA polymerase subunit RPC12/RpoP
MIARQIKLLIEHQCPQCGAPIVLEETDRLFVCQYCKVKSFLFPGDFFRYTLPHSSSKERNLIYLPYWRFKGILFSSLADRIDHRIVDVSHQALLSDYFPVSLGLRSQALKLRFVSPETGGYFLNPSISFKDMVQLTEKRTSTELPEPVFTRCFIGETLSLIYSPFYVNGRIHDAVLDRPIASSPPDDFDMTALPGGTPSWTTGVWTRPRRKRAGSLPPLLSDCRGNQGHRASFLCGSGEGRQSSQGHSRRDGEKSFQFLVTCIQDSAG